MNLLTETIKDIKTSGHAIKDIVFIGSESSGHCCNWDEYKVVANIGYDSGYGAQEVAKDLIIVFSDGSQMWRHEYDGSENWDYSLPFIMPEVKKTLTKVMGGGMWETLEDMNN